MLFASGRWAPPRQVSPIIVHPKLSFGAKGICLGPMIWSWMWYEFRLLDQSVGFWIQSYRGEDETTSGVGISFLVSARIWNATRARSRHFYFNWFIWSFVLIIVNMRTWNSDCFAKLSFVQTEQKSKTFHASFWICCCSPVLRGTHSIPLISPSWILVK